MSKPKNSQNFYSRLASEGKKEIFSELSHQISCLKGIQKKALVLSRHLKNSRNFTNRINKFSQQLTYTIAFFEILMGMGRISQIITRENKDILLNTIAFKVRNIVDSTCFIDYFT